MASLCITALLAAPEEEGGTDKSSKNNDTDDNTSGNSGSVGATLVRLFGVRGSGCGLGSGSLCDDDSLARGDAGDDSCLVRCSGCGCCACY